MMQRILQKLAQSRLPLAFRRFAVKSLHDQEALYQLAVEGIDEGICKMAIDRLQNKDLIPLIAKEARSQYVRLIAVEKVKDKNTLERIALNEEFQRVYEEAIRKIEDNKIIAKIASNAVSFGARIFALSRINDDHLLIGFAANYQEADSIRIAAIKQLKNDQILKEFCLQEKNIDLLALAVTSMEDQQQLMEAAIRTSRTFVRELILLRLDEDHSEQFSQLMKDKYSDQRLQADIKQQLEKLPTIKYDFDSFLQQAIQFRSEGFKSILYHIEEYTEEGDAERSNPNQSERQDKEGYSGNDNSETIHGYRKIPGKIVLKKGDVI